MPRMSRSRRTISAAIVRYASSPGRPSDLKNWAVPDGVNTLTFTRRGQEHHASARRRASRNGCLFGLVMEILLWSGTATILCRSIGLCEA